MSMTMAAAAIAAAGPSGYPCVGEIHLWTSFASGILVGVSGVILVLLWKELLS